MNNAIWNMFVGMFLLKVAGIGQMAAVGWGWVLSPLILLTCLILFMTFHVQGMIKRAERLIAGGRREEAKEELDKIEKAIARAMRKMEE